MNKSQRHQQSLYAWKIFIDSKSKEELYKLFNIKKPTLKEIIMWNLKKIKDKYIKSNIHKKTTTNNIDGLVYMEALLTDEPLEATFSGPFFCTTGNIPSNWFLIVAEQDPDTLKWDVSLGSQDDHTLYVSSEEQDSFSNAILDCCKKIKQI